MNDGLVLTLGHGSSAILIIDNKIVNGYQTERLTKVKGDSSFPYLAIAELMKYHKIPMGIDLFISHWEPFYDIFAMRPKHYNWACVHRMFGNSDIYTMRNYISHHDSHAQSVMAYNNKPIPDNAHIIVADGFGNGGEVISIYRIVKGVPYKIHAVPGYANSLGLLYQYATSYMGLKENQDEWKLNAYANQATDDEQKIAEIEAREYIQLVKPQTDLHIEALGGVKSFVHKYIDENLYPVTKGKVAVFLQNVVRGVIENLIDAWDIENLYLAGGCFLNVQLNGELLDKLKGTICVNPLSGDEGAGLGLFKEYNKNFTMPTDLCFGIREIADDTHNVEGLIYTKHLSSNVKYYLSRDKIVNVVKGGMEFGPRAYCNTSTICNASLKNKALINDMNSRPGIMPLCPVMTDAMAKTLFKDLPRVIRSYEHMAIALEVPHDIPGATYKTLSGKYTCRPQVVGPEHWMHPICKEFGVLINTSFNNHGHPICFSIEDAMRTHIAMRKVNPEIVTLVEIGDK